MNIIPVLDVLNGVVVHGVAGNRDEYRPIQSRLTTSIAPLDVANAIRAALSLDTFYVADLDAILHDRPNYDIYRELSSAGFQIWVDAGLRDMSRGRTVLKVGAAGIVAGLETLPGPGVLENLCRECDPQNIVFSLDLRGGQPLGDLSRWNATQPLDIARQAISMGVERLIVLDLAAVGIGDGPATLPLCRELRREFPELEIITGGGIRDGGDLRACHAAQVDGVLIASAIHHGTIDRLTLETAVTG